MFGAGYDSEGIKRWGRWKSDTFSCYLRNDDRVLATVGTGMIKSIGLMGQLERQSDRDLAKQVGREEGRDGGKGAPPFQRGRQAAREEERRGEEYGGLSTRGGIPTIGVVVERRVHTE